MLGPVATMHWLAEKSVAAPLAGTLIFSVIFLCVPLHGFGHALAGVIHKFSYLKIGLGVVPVFIGIKMLLARTDWKTPTVEVLVVVTMILLTSIAVPFWHNNLKRKREEILRVKKWLTDG